MVDDSMHAIKEINTISLIIFIFLNKGSDPNKDYEHQSSREIRSPKVKPMDPSKLSMVCRYARQFSDLNLKKKIDYILCMSGSFSGFRQNWTSILQSKIWLKELSCLKTEQRQR